MGVELFIESSEDHRLALSSSVEMKKLTPWEADVRDGAANGRKPEFSHFLPWRDLHQSAKPCDSPTQQSWASPKSHCSRTTLVQHHRKSFPHMDSETSVMKIKTKIHYLLGKCAQAFYCMFYIVQIPVLISLFFYKVSKWVCWPRSITPGYASGFGPDGISSTFSYLCSILLGNNEFWTICTIQVKLKAASVYFCKYVVG